MKTCQTLFNFLTLVLAKHTTNLSVVGCVCVTTPEPTLTAENVARVVKIVAADKRKEMWDVSIVPEPQLEEIYHKYSTEEQRMHACADFYVSCNPQSSWTHLYWELFSMKETAAARKAKTFIPQTGR